MLYITASICIYVFLFTQLSLHCPLSTPPLLSHPLPPSWFSRISICLQLGNCFFVHFVKWIFHVAHRTYLKFVCCVSFVDLYALCVLFFAVHSPFHAKEALKFLSRRQLILWLHELRASSEFKLDFCAH